TGDVSRRVRRSTRRLTSPVRQCLVSPTRKRGASARPSLALRANKRWPQEVARGHRMFPMKPIAFLLLFIAAPALRAEPAERCLLHPKPEDLSADLRPVVEK